MLKTMFKFPCDFSAPEIKVMSGAAIHLPVRHNIGSHSGFTVDMLAWVSYQCSKVLDA